MCFGMRPEYVRIGLQYPNFKMIWFPSFTSYGFWRSAGLPDHDGVRLCSEDGKVLPEVKPDHGNGRREESRHRLRPHRL